MRHLNADYNKSMDVRCVAAPTGHFAAVVAALQL
jgi:hypothetical protein